MSTEVLKSAELPLVEEFLRCLTSVHTVRAYERDLSEFKAYLLTQPATSGWNSTLSQYKAFLRERFQPLTCNRKLSCLKSYFNFLYMNRVTDVNFGAHVSLFSKSEYSGTPALSDDEVTRMFSLVENVRDELILKLMFYLGLRRAELISIKLEDLNLEGIPSIKIHGKGHKTRILPITDDILVTLKAYLSNLLARKYTGARLFPGVTAETIHPNTVAQIFHKYSKLAGLERIATPHVARATCVSNALERGANPVQVQQLGGWTSMEMVLRYDKRRHALKNSAAFVVNYAPKNTGK